MVYQKSTSQILKYFLHANKLATPQDQFIGKWKRYSTPHVHVIRLQHYHAVCDKSFYVPVPPCEYYITVL